MKASIYQDINYITSLLDGLPSGSLKNALGHEMLFYAKKARLYKILFHILTGLTVIMPAIVTAISSMCTIEPFYCKCAISVISALSTISAGLIGVFSMKEHWTTYRVNCEFLKRELLLYLNSVSPYDNMDAQLNEKLFIKNSGHLFVEEANQWKADVNRKKDL